MKFIRFAFLLLNVGLLHAQHADFIPLPIAKGERAVSLTPTGIAESEGGDVLLETVNPQGEIRHRLIFIGNRITELPSGWRVLPGEGPTSILVQKEGRLACFYWNYSDYTKHGISFNLSPGEQSAWRNLRSEILVGQSTAPQKGCGFGFDDDAGTHHSWFIAPEGAREVAHHPISSVVRRDNQSVGSASCLESCLIIQGVNITNTGYGPLDQSSPALEDHTSEVDEPQFVCNPDKGLLVRHTKVKNKLVTPATVCDEATLYQAECVLDVLLIQQGKDRTVSIADIDQAKIFRSLPINEGEHAYIAATWCVPQFYFLSNGIAYRVGDPSQNRDLSIATLHPESLSPISRQETDSK